MADEPQSTLPTANWRFGIIIGLSIGVGIATSREVEKALEPSMGHWGALLIGIVAAGLISGLVALIVVLLMGRGKGGRA